MAARRKKAGRKKTRKAKRRKRQARQKTLQPRTPHARFIQKPLPGIREEELTGTLIVIEGPDGSGRSTQVALLTEWLESNGFAVGSMGLRRSNLLARDIDELLAKNMVTPMTLSLMYATDFFDQMQNSIIPALRAGMVVLADRYFFTLIARGAVRGIKQDYLRRIYDLAIRPDLVFWLDVSPGISFDREFRKAQAISYWEAGRDVYYSEDLYKSFNQYQSHLRKEFDKLAREFSFTRVDGEEPIQKVNNELRKVIGKKLGIAPKSFRPSRSLAPYWH